MTSKDKGRLYDIRMEADAALKAARAARLNVTHAYAQCARGIGSGPSMQQIEQADSLEARADELWRSLDAALLHFTF